MTIHLKIDETNDEIMRGTRNFITDDGYKLPIGITSETDESVVQAYLLLANQNEAEYVRLAKAADAAREINFSLIKHGQQGKFHPEFRALERFQVKLARQANLIDS